MNYLIGDIGNTNIKICKLNKNFKIINTYLFETKNKNLKSDISRKLRKISKKNTNKKVLFSSVVPSVYKNISKIFQKNRLKVFEIKKFDLKKIMKFRVKKYSQLGSDRIANAIGAYQKFKTDCIVIDFGTATTFDVIKKNGINFRIVLTGGYSYLFKNRLIKKAKIENDITMQGIIKIYKDFLR